MSRLAALCRKETLQIVRDPSSIIIAFVIPVMLLLISGYGINFDSTAVRVGLLLEDQSPVARSFAYAFTGSPFFEVTFGDNREQLTDLIERGSIRGIVIVQPDFSRKLAAKYGTAPVQVITDGSDPNTANFVQGYVKGAWRIWLQSRARDRGMPTDALIGIEERYWFNPATISRHFIVPGTISVILTVVGAILTSLVIARERERGTLEALLATRITKTELLLSKFLPYYILGLLALVVCMIIATLVMGVPFRGSPLILFATSSLFLVNALGLGLLISTTAKNQFNAAQISLNAAFLPAVMLSGYVFEIDSMPAVVRAITRILPARYYVTIMKTMFLTGNVASVLLINAAFLLGLGTLLMAATYMKTKRRLE